MIKIRISIQICSKDRWSEISLLLQSLRTSTYQNWDLIILDECSTPMGNCNFLQVLFFKIKLEGHRLKYHRNDFSFGVCYARNKLLELDSYDNELILRLDDDVILEPDYIEKLVKVIENGYDIASGITPPMAYPLMKRDNNFIRPIINEMKFDSDGNIVKHGDDCGFAYMEDEILPAHQFRSCALYKKSIGIKYETNLSPTGFREEAFFSIRARCKGFKIGVHTGALAYHLMCPSGGVRAMDYAQRVQSDDTYFNKWVKVMYNSHKEELS